MTSIDHFNEYWPIWVFLYIWNGLKWMSIITEFIQLVNVHSQHFYPIVFKEHLQCLWLFISYDWVEVVGNRLLQNAYINSYSLNSIYLIALLYKNCVFYFKYHPVITVIEHEKKNVCQRLKLTFTKRLARTLIHTQNKHSFQLKYAFDICMLKGVLLIQPCFQLQTII